MKRCLPGINIQFPISRLILSGDKTIETRTYPIPKKYIGKDLALVETPGPKGQFKARIIGVVRFSRCFKYESETAFYKDSKRHRVTPRSPWKWRNDRPKWGWQIDFMEPLDKEVPLQKRPGIVFTLAVQY